MGQFDLTPPYFIFLKGEFYDKFISGVQDIEVRPNNSRGWNSTRIYEGRLVWISRGYGVDKRRLLRIRSTKIVQNEELSLASWHKEAVLEIYGERTEWLLAELEEATKDELSQELARQAKIKVEPLTNVKTANYKGKLVYLKQNNEFAFTTRRYAIAQATRLAGKFPNSTYSVFLEQHAGKPYFFIEVQHE